MRNVLDEIRRGYQNALAMFNNYFFFGHLTIYEIMWKIMVQPDRPQVAM